MGTRRAKCGEVLSRLQEAEHYLKLLRQDQVVSTDPRLQEWGHVTTGVLCFAFGQLSPYYRQLQGLVVSSETDRGVYFYRLSRCLVRARRDLKKNGLPNGGLDVPEGLELPDYLYNRAYERERIALRSWWTLFWSGHTFESYKL